MLAHVEALTRLLLNATTVGEALQQVVYAAATAIPGADLVSVMPRAPDGTFHTPAESDPAASELDPVQYSSGRGPCVDAALPDAPGYVTSADLRTELRWPEFAAAAAGYGYRTILSTEIAAPLSPRRLSGALNIYSRRPAGPAASPTTTGAPRCCRPFTPPSRWLTPMPPRSPTFTLLRATSQNLNVKLVTIARTVTDRHDELDTAEPTFSARTRHPGDGDLASGGSVQVGGRDAGYPDESASPASGRAVQRGRPPWALGLRALSRAPPPSGETVPSVHSVGKLSDVWRAPNSWENA